MTISVQSGLFNKASDDSTSNLAISPGGTVQDGDLLIVVCASYRIPVGFSSGWTEFVTTGTAGNYLRCLWRIADLSENDELTGSFLISGQVSMVMGVFRATSGWDSSCIVSHSENAAGSTSGTTYALASALTGVTAGQLSVALGGDVGTSLQNQTMGLTGTSWTDNYSPDGTAYGHAAAGSNTTTGTISIPSVTYSNSVSNIKFIAAMVLKEQVTAGLSGGGLFWPSA